MVARSPDVEAFLASLPEDRREAMSAVRDAVLAGLSDGFEEGTDGRFVSWHVPHSLYPAGYHCNPKQPLPFAALSATKSGMSLHLFCVYGNEARKAEFVAKWTGAGKKLDMGAACVRFKRLSDVPLDVVTDTIRSIPLEAWVEGYRATLDTRSARR